MAVGVSHGNDYALRTHLAAARAKGLTDAMYAEFMAVVQLAAGVVVGHIGSPLQPEPLTRPQFLAEPVRLRDRQGAPAGRRTGGG